MVSITAEIFPPAAQHKTRKVFAFGLVKVKRNTADSQAEQADDIRVLGLMIMEEQTQPADENA